MVAAGIGRARIVLPPLRKFPMDQLHYKSATELASLIRRKKIGCARTARPLPRARRKIQSEAQRHHLDGPRQGAQARQSGGCRAEEGQALRPAARRADDASRRAIQVAGSPTTWGVPAMKDNVTDETAVSAQRMIDAGVTLFGKTNVPLMLADWQSYNAGLRHDRQSVGPRAARRAARPAARRPRCRPASPASTPAATSARRSAIRRITAACSATSRPTGSSPMRGHALPNAVAAPDISVVGPLARSARGPRRGARHHGGARPRRWRLPEGRAAEMREDLAEAIPRRREAHRSGERRRRRVCRPTAGAGRQAREGRREGEGSRARHRHRAAARRLHPPAARRDLGAHAGRRDRGLEAGARRRRDRTNISRRRSMA